MKKAMLYIVALMFSAGANAATFDFLAIANTGEYGAPSIDFLEDGIALTATAPGANAYLDAGDAGLGVCQVLDGADQCNPGSDDNVQSSESLLLTFAGEVILTQFSFLNGAHGTDFTGTFTLLVDGVAAFTDELLTTGFDVFLTGTEFSFINTSTGGLHTDEFYISSVSAVPVPAALFLFAPALLGFFGLRRKATLAA